ncbi:MAG: type III pantothenate kinase [Ruminococcus sp.]|jgi:type III pantothenate kinase|nr:type III pantothenate kinase [Ruminococcus sp.]
MILCINAGNDTTSIAGFTEKETVFSASYATQTGVTPDEYADKLLRMLSLHKRSVSEIEGIVIACVATPLTPIIKEACSMFTSVKILRIIPGVKTGLNIKTDNPAALGANLVGGSVAAIKKYGAPCVIFDYGASTVVSVIDADKCYRGGMIIPGLRASVNALTNSAAQLPDISLDPDALFGLLCTSTAACMQSGAVYSAACAMDGIAKRYRTIIGSNAKFIVTGKIAKIIIPYCEESYSYDEYLVLRGLYEIYRKNEK